MIDPYKTQLNCEFYKNTRMLFSPLKEINRKNAKPLQLFKFKDREGKRVKAEKEAEINKTYVCIHVYLCVHGHVFKSSQDKEQSK